MSESGFPYVGARRVTRSRFLTLERGYYRTPDGGWMVRELIRHPGCVVVIPWDGRTIRMIRQFRAAAGTTLLELPAGKLDVPGEPPEVTARREAIEEIGMRPGRLRLLHRTFLSPGFTDEVCHIYLAEDLEPVAVDPQGAEERHAEIVTMTLEEVTAELGRGSIIDAKTLIGCYALLGAREP